MTRDVAYDSLPYSVRTVLHGRVGDVLEAEPDGPRRHLDLLAYHYARSEDLPKMRHYLGAAAAAARAAYANEAAVSYLEQVLPLVEPDERHGVLLELAESLEVGGDWAAAEDAVTPGAGVGRARGPARAAWPGPAPRRPSWPASRGGTPRPRPSWPRPSRPVVEIDDQAGRARVLHLRGTLASQQGHPDRGPGRLRGEPRAARERSGTRPGWPRCSPTSRWSRRTRTTWSRPSGSARRDSPGAGRWTTTAR